MALSPNLESYFQPEDRVRGEDLFHRELVYLQSASDQTVRASLKAPGAPRVSLDADDVSSVTFTAACTCPSFKKGHVCKHIWATLLALDARDADFLSAKVDLSVREAATAAPSPAKEAQRARADAFKARAKALRRERKGLPPKTSAPSFPAEVEEALVYFKLNGFDLADDLAPERVLDAKRTLARVFHPDRGGSHDEAIELNHHFDVLAGFIG